jgi:hypothetical protein
MLWQENTKDVLLGSWLTYFHKIKYLLHTFQVLPNNYILHMHTLSYCVKTEVEKYIMKVLLLNGG